MMSSTRQMIRLDLAIRQNGLIVLVWKLPSTTAYYTFYNF